MTYAEKLELAALENQIVSLTGYLVLAYAGPPETTNCGSVDFHDWHLEVFERPQDHPPEVGDATPIIVETTPRLQNSLYQAGVRLEQLAALMRRPDMTYEPTGHPARRVRFTGYLLWDDDHNGAADIGPRITTKAKNGYNQPWRSTAFEIHPVLKIEALDALAPPVATATPDVAPPAIAPNPAGAVPSAVTVVEAVKIKIPYGETVIPRGTKLGIVSRNASTVTVHYLGQDVVVPLKSTDLQ